MDWEIEHHLEEMTERLIEHNLDPEEARCEAERRFGDVNAVRAQVRAVDRLRVPGQVLARLILRN